MKKFSNLQEIRFNVEYIEDYFNNDGITEDHPFLPQTYAMQLCMSATKINRLFTREDMYEFLFRLAIILQKKNVMENWFSSWKLLDFFYKDKVYTLTAQDVTGHFGLEIIDDIVNYSPRGSFFNDLMSGLTTAALGGFLMGCNILWPEHDENGEQVYTVRDENVPQPDAQLLHNAEVFARDVMSLAPEGYFDRLTPARLEKMKEIEERKKAIAELPQFDLKAVPRETVEKCMNIMCGKRWENAKKDWDPEELEDETRRLLHLAWLYANDMIIMMDNGEYKHAEEVEGVILDDEAYSYDYEYDYEGVNLYMTYVRYNMEKVLPLLKGIGMKEKGSREK